MFTDRELREAFCTLAMEVIAFNSGDITPKNVLTIILEIILATGRDEAHDLNLHTIAPDTSEILALGAIKETITQLLADPSEPHTLII